MTLTAEQYRASIQTQQELVRQGWHPAEAGMIVRRAIDRVKARGCCESCPPGRSCKDDGLGIQQTRSLRRDLNPSIAPRPVIAGEQCVRIQEIPGDETRMYQQLDDYRNRGWNVMEIEPTKGFESVRVFWACPPGRTPMESQGQILVSEAWGGPLRPGLGAETVPTKPVTVLTGTSPSILANVAAAGDDPSVAAARNIVSKWSWLIPVGGLLMSAKRKVAEWSTPTTSAIVGRRR